MLVHIQQKIKWKNAFQGLDQQSLFSPITKKTWTVTNAKKIPSTFNDAFKLAMSPRRGPVCINLPRNILATSKNFKINNKVSYESESSVKGKISKIKKAVKLIKEFKKSYNNRWVVELNMLENIKK